MKARLMTKLGVDEKVAAQAIASLPSGILLDVLDFIERIGPYAKSAVIIALPFLLKGDTWGAVKAVVTHFVGLMPVTQLPASQTPPTMPEASSVLVSHIPDHPPADVPAKPHSKKR